MIRPAEGFTALHELRAHAPGVRNIHPADAVAARPARAVERRSTAVYVPAWLRLVQPLRWFLPPVVLRLASAPLGCRAATACHGQAGRRRSGDRAAAPPDDGRPG